MHLDTVIILSQGFINLGPTSAMTELNPVCELDSKEKYQWDKIPGQTGIAFHRKITRRSKLKSNGIIKSNAEILDNDTSHLCELSNSVSMKNQRQGKISDITLISTLLKRKPQEIIFRDGISSPLDKCRLIWANQPGFIREKVCLLKVPFQWWGNRQGQWGNCIWCGVISLWRCVFVDCHKVSLSLRDWSPWNKKIRNNMGKNLTVRQERGSNSDSLLLGLEEGVQWSPPETTTKATASLCTSQWLGLPWQDFIF